MENHIKVARVHRLLSWLYIVLGIGIMAAIIIPAKGNLSPAVIFPGLYLLALFAIHHFTATGAQPKRVGARIASMIIAFFLLFGFPIGTVIGLYLLINTWGSWDKPAVEDTSVAEIAH